jgi:hypothetical protein
MKYLLTTKLTVKLILPVLTSAILFISNGLSHLSESSPSTVEIPPSPAPVQASPVAAPQASTKPLTESLLPVTSALPQPYPFANPAGCSVVNPGQITATQMLANVLGLIGNEYNLAERR